MTKEKLEQVYFITKEIDMWRRELQRLRCKSEVGSLKLDGMAKGSVSGSATEQTALAIGECQEIIIEKLKEMEAARREVIIFIKGIDDSQVRQIVYYRNCCLMPWKEVAKMIGDGYSSESIRQTYRRFINKNCHTCHTDNKI